MVQRRPMSRAIAIVAGVVLLSTPYFSFAAAGVPLIIAHQGMLLDSSGNLLGGGGTNFCFRFSIYDDSVVGAPDTKLWPSGTPLNTTVNVKSGRYSTNIGTADVLSYNFQDSDEVYLNIEVANSVGGSCVGVDVFENLGPRKRILSAPYAINSKTVGGIPVGGTATSLTLTGANALTLTTTGATNVTLPTTGTLATLAGAETFTNKTLTSPTINTPTIAGGTATALTGLAVRSTGSAFDLTIANTEVLTAGRTLTVKTNDVARTLDLGGNLTIAGALTTSGAFALTLTTTADSNVTLPTSGTLATLAGTESFSNKTGFTSDVDDTRSIGTAANRWKDLFLGPASLHIGSTAGQTGTARDWTFDIRTTADVVDRGNLRILEGATRVADFTPGGALIIGTSTSPATRLAIWGSGTATQPLFIATDSASSTLLTLLENGNLALGTSTPYAQFTIWSATSSQNTTVLNVVDNASTTLFTILNNGNVGIGTTTPTLGPLVLNSGAYVTAGGTWTNASSRNLKENFTPVSAEATLTKINQLDISRWNYKTESASTTHIGPIAQDFYTAFGTGGTSGNTSISTIDPSGVALLGIQGLSKKYNDLEARVTSALASASIVMQNAIVKFQEITAHKITVTRAEIDEAIINTATIVKLKILDLFQIRDRATGELVCVFIENGAWRQERCPDGPAIANPSSGTVGQQGQLIGLPGDATASTSPTSTEPMIPAPPITPAPVEAPTSLSVPPINAETFAPPAPSPFAAPPTLAPSEVGAPTSTPTVPSEQVVGAAPTEPTSTTP